MFHRQMESSSEGRHKMLLGQKNGSARNLGFFFDSKLSMKKHVIKIGQIAYFELKRISSVRRFL